LQKVAIYLELDLEKTKKIGLTLLRLLLSVNYSLSLNMKSKCLSTHIEMHNLFLLSENMFAAEGLPSAQKVSLMFWQSKRNLPSGYCFTFKECADYICNDGLGAFLSTFMYRHQEAQTAKSEILTLVFYSFFSIM